MCRDLTRVRKKDVTNGSSHLGLGEPAAALGERKLAGAPLRGNTSGRRTQLPFRHKSAGDHPTYR